MKKDKIKHFIAGLLLSLLGFVHPTLFAVGLAAGMGKEVNDKLTGKGHAELADIAYTWAGCAVTMFVYIIISFYRGAFIILA